MTNQPIMIGPLTGDEWALFALPVDDERNPLPPCCGNLEEARNAIFGVFRAGGDPDLYWRSIAEVWPIVEAHIESGEIAKDPILSKLHTAYVAGRPPIERDGEALARLLARDSRIMRQLMDALTGPDSMWDLKTREGQIEAVARLGGVFIATVLDPDERHKFAAELADVLGWDDAELCVVIDVMRQSQGLPYEPTHPEHRGS